MDMPTGQSSHLELVDIIYLDMRHDVVKIPDRIAKREKKEIVKVGSSRQRCQIGAVRHRDIGSDPGSKANRKKAFEAF